MALGKLPPLKSPPLVSGKQRLQCLYQPALLELTHRPGWTRARSREDARRGKVREQRRRFALTVLAGALNLELAGLIQTARSAKQRLTHRPAQYHFGPHPCPKKAIGCIHQHPVRSPGAGTCVQKSQAKRRLPLAFYPTAHVGVTWRHLGEVARRSERGHGGDQVVHAREGHQVHGDFV